MTEDKSLVKSEQHVRLFSSRRQPPLLVIETSSEGSDRLQIFNQFWQKSCPSITILALSNAANCVLVFVCLEAISNQSWWWTKRKNFFCSTLRDYCIAVFFINLRKIHAIFKAFFFSALFDAASCISVYLFI